MKKEQFKAQAEALLNEKLSDEQLDEVAGGSFEENQEIFYAMMDVDPNGTMEFLKGWDQRASNYKETLRDGLGKLLRKNFSAQGMDVVFLGGIGDRENQYMVDGKTVSHETFMSYLSAMGNSDDF